MAFFFDVDPYRSKKPLKLYLKQSNLSIMLICFIFFFKFPLIIYHLRLRNIPTLNDLNIFAFLLYYLLVVIIKGNYKVRRQEINK